MAAAPVQAQAFEVELCELVEVGGGDALLRVTGSWSPAPPERVDLVSFGDGALERIEPLPPGAAASADGRWHVAFCVGETAATAHLALMTPAGAAVGLPAPEKLLSAPSEPPAAQPEPATPDLEERLEHALEDLADAKALVDQLRRRCELSERGLAEFRDKLVSAWGEAASMRELLDEREAAHEAAKQRAREADAIVAEVEARARRSRSELAARRDEMEQQCARLQAELEERTSWGQSAVEHLAATESIRAEADEALARFERARHESESLKAELRDARALAEEAAAATARAAREILDERMKAEDAAHEADVYSERLAKAERELGEAREALAVAESATGDVRELAAALESESARADAATRRVEDAERELESARADLVAIAAHVETLEANAAGATQGAAGELAAERTRAEQAGGRAAAAEQALAEAREELAVEKARADEAARRAGEAEWQLSEARERLARGVTESGNPTPAQVAVEEDLRHLLERRERELEEVRAELAEQRARYTAVASEVPPAEEPPTPPKAEPWSRVDEDLLDRLARAKSLAGQD